MTEQEYKQKRRECFVKFCKDNGIDQEVNISIFDAFDQIFDRAFALGKQEKDKDTVIQGWVFVDETTFDRILCVRKVTQREYEAVWDSGHPEFCLGNELFPDMVPNTLPEPVEITIKRKKK